MPRGKTSSREAKHSPRSRKSVAMTCGASACQQVCWTKTYGGEIFTSEYCEKHSCEPRPELGVCLARKRSKDAFCHEHSTCQFLYCKRPIDPQYGPFSSCCPYHKCRIQDCPHAIADPTIPFCSHHDPSIYHGLHYLHSLRSSSMEYAPRQSPPQTPTEEKPVDSTKPSEDLPPPSTAVDVADTSEKSCTCAQDAAETEIKPTCTPVTRPVEPRTEPKVESVDAVVDEGKGEGRDEMDKMPTFFSGVAVGICLLMQIVYAVLQLLLETARSTAKWRN
ncbi:hypothetical protein V8C37DRAFT_380367 [Trichoderma ceciliae]